MADAFLPLPRPLMIPLLLTLLFFCLATSLGLAVLARHLHRKLSALQRAFDTLITKAPVAVVQTDAAGRNTLANEAWCKLSGLTAEETATNWQTVIHPEDLPSVTARWQQAIQARESYTNELRLVRPDGSQREVVTVVHPVGSADNSEGGFIGVVLDVTELQAARRQVREQDRLLKSLIDHSSAAMYVKDAEGRYMLANQALRELCVEPAAFRLGATALDCFPADVARSIVATDRRVLETGQTQTFEEMLPHADGDRTFLLVKFPIRDDAGRVVAVGGISSDVTALRLVQRQLAERERVLRNLIDLQEQERQLICHEFHDGLIQYVVGATMLLEKLHEDPQLPSQATAVLGDVMKCLRKGLEDARRVIRGIRPATLDDLGLQAAINDLVGELEADGVQVEMTMEGSFENIDVGLHTVIYRVFQEVFNNVAQHSGADRVTCVITADASGLSLTVQDFGVGFDPAAPSKGFGLTGIRERVRLAGGDYALQTSPGEGTRVHVRLPAEVSSHDRGQSGGAHGSSDGARETSRTQARQLG